MQIISSNVVDMTTYGKNTPCHVHCIHVKIKDIDSSAREMTETIQDTSWISKLNDADQKLFKATSDRTIKKLVADILKKVSGAVTEDFGEYLISYSAQKTLESDLAHLRLPLSELLKEKESGNPGFDFHTESHRKHIVFGEAKYSAKKTPRANALNQISKFIKLKKHDADIGIVRPFVSAEALDKMVKSDLKGFVAAFSLNSDNPDRVFKNALKSKVIDELTCFPELYLIAIEV